MSSSMILKMWSWGHSIHTSWELVHVQTSAQTSRISSSGAKAQQSAFQAMWTIPMHTEAWEALLSFV